MKFRVENGEVFLKYWWLFKEISLKNVTHIIENDTKLYSFYEGKKCIYQCQWSFESIELALEVFKQPACQYIEYLRFEDEEEIDYKIIDVNEQEEYVKCKENEVQEIIEKYNNEHKIKIKAEFGYDEHLGYYCYYISQDKEDAPWVFQCRPVEHHIWHKDTSKNEFYKCDYWKEQFKSDLKLLNKILVRYNELPNNKVTVFNVLKGFGMFLLFIWSAFVSIFRPVFYTMFYYYISGKMCIIDNIDMETSLCGGVFIGAVWFMFVTIPLIILINYLRKINNKLPLIAVVIMIIIGVCFLALSDWNMTQYLVG